MTTTDRLVTTVRDEIGQTNIMSMDALDLESVVECMALDLYDYRMDYDEISVLVQDATLELLRGNL